MPKEQPIEQSDGLDLDAQLDALMADLNDAAAHDEQDQEPAGAEGGQALGVSSEPTSADEPWDSVDQLVDPPPDLLADDQDLADQLETDLNADTDTDVADHAAANFEVDTHPAVPPTVADVDDSPPQAVSGPDVTSEIADNSVVDEAVDIETDADTDTDIEAYVAAAEATLADPTEETLDDTDTLLLAQDQGSLETADHREAEASTGMVDPANTDTLSQLDEEANVLSAVDTRAETQVDALAPAMTDPETDHPAVDEVPTDMDSDIPATAMETEAISTSDEQAVAALDMDNLADIPVEAPIDPGAESVVVDDADLKTETQEQADTGEATDSITTDTLQQMDEEVDIDPAIDIPTDVDVEALADTDTDLDTDTEGQSAIQSLANTGLDVPVEEAVAGDAISQTGESPVVEPMADTPSEPDEQAPAETSTELDPGVDGQDQMVGQAQVDPAPEPAVPTESEANVGEDQSAIPQADLSEQLDALFASEESDSPPPDATPPAVGDAVNASDENSTEPVSEPEANITAGTDSSDDAGQVDDADLAAELDRVFGDLNADAAAGGTAMTETPPETAPAAPQADVAATADTDSADDGDLANQLDALFGQAQGDESAGADSSPPSGAPAQAASQDPSASDESITLDQIDQMLAEQADSTVSGDFDTVNDVANADSFPDEPEDEAEPAGEKSMFEEPILCSDDTPLDRGSKPKASSDPTPSRRSGASAQDVAAELDADANLVQTLDDDDDLEIPDDSQSLPPQTLPVRLLRLVCIRPFAGLSPQVRDTIGYFALLHVLVGTVLICKKVLEVVF